MDSSPRFSLNWHDVGRVLLFALMVGVAAAIVSLSQNLGLLDLGSLQAFAVAGLGTLLELVRRWLANHNPTPKFKRKL